MREQFEKLPSIKPFKSAFKFNEEIGEYVRNDSHYYLQPEYQLGFFNGAWYAYQEQRKRIDAVLNIISQSESYCDRSVFGLQDEIKELLK